MTTMKKQLLPVSALVLVVAIFSNLVARAQMSTPAGTAAELEAVYTGAIEDRAADILKALNLSDATKSKQVHDIIISQYRTLRARDAFLDATLKAEGKEVNYSNRAPQLEASTKPLHDQFLHQLSALLTAQQVETVKDKLTYNKVKVTYDAYVAIVPGLNADEKAKIMDLLKHAREEAIDGGSAPEKSAVFQKYKDQINNYLTAQGHDVSKAFQDWQARQTATNNTVTATTHD
jgi:hypothetical protein